MTTTDRPPVWTRWRTLQLVLVVWLLASGPLYPFGASWEAQVKDLVAGAVLLVVTMVAAAGRSEGTAERVACLVLGAALLAGALILDDGVGAGSIAARWNQVVVGVLLICLAAVRTRA